MKIISLIGLEMWLPFVSYLEAHPKNKGQWYGRISADYRKHISDNKHTDFVDTHNGVTFEKIFIMMRNIIS